MAMYCKNCGASLPENVKFCSACGTETGFAAQAVPGVAPGVVRSALVRPREGRKVAGVCAGFAKAYGWDVLLVRILVIVGGIILFPFTEIAYIVAWLAIPDEPFTLPATTGVPPGSF